MMLQTYTMSALVKQNVMQSISIMDTFIEL